MRKMFFLIVTVSILIPLSAPASTEQLGIGVFDYIISRTDFNVETCEAYINFMESISQTQLFSF